MRESVLPHFPAYRRTQKAVVPQSHSAGAKVLETGSRATGLAYMFILRPVPTEEDAKGVGRELLLACMVDGVNWLPMIVLLCWLSTVMLEGDSGATGTSLSVWIGGEVGIWL